MRGPPGGGQGGGEVGGRVVGPGRVELTAAMGTTSVVMGLVLGQDRPQMPLAEGQHPVGDLGPGREHEPFRPVRIGPLAGDQAMPLLAGCELSFRDRQPWA